MKKLTIILCLSLALVFGCKKYPEGPKITFRSPEKRLEGNWKVKSFYKDGEDYLLPEFYGSQTKLPCGGFVPGTTVYIKSCYDRKSELSSMIFEFKKDNKLTEKWTNEFYYINVDKSNNDCNCTYDPTNNKEEDIYEENWSMNKDKSILTIEYKGQRKDFEILKLTNKELSLYHKATTNTKDEKITLEKQ